MNARAMAWKNWGVWISRVLSGAMFIVSGWSKLVDPWGFAFKINEYLSVWGFGDVLPDGMTGFVGCAISLFELCVGVLLFTGSLRRFAPISGLLMMAFWLPLTVYIAIADPVADCGCFGDFLIISNTATLIKNIFLTALLVVCLCWHDKGGTLFRPSLQWLIPTLTIVYGIVIAFIGWHLQPIVDFRPYPVGKKLIDKAEEPPIIYIYSKDGIQREFPLDALPDSTWTFERIKDQPKDSQRLLAVFDGEDEITEDIFGDDVPDEMIVLIYPKPGYDDLLHARLANEINDYAEAHGIEMVGIVAASDKYLEQWESLVRPDYKIYTSDDTSLKQLVRGPVGIIYLKNGTVVWKRNFASISPDFLSNDDPFGSVWIVDDGRVAVWLSIFYIAGLLLLLAISKLTSLNLRPPMIKAKQADKKS